MPITIDQKTYYVPGVYGAIEVVDLGPVSLPAFNTLLVIGSARSGLPSAAAGSNGLTGADVIKAYTSVSDARRFFGDGNLIDAMQYTKSGGAGVVYLLNAANLTQLSCTIKDNAGTPVNTMLLTANRYGAYGNDISLTVATTDSKPTYTIIPPKNEKFLTVVASLTSKNITLETVDGLAVGQTVLVTDNTATSPQSTTITAINADTNVVTLADLPTTAYAITSSARLFQEDTDNQETHTFESTDTIDDVINWINSGKTLTASRSTYTGVVPGTLSKIYLQNVASATKGTSLVATETAGGDFDTVANDAPQLFEEFTNYTKSGIRIINVISADSGVHAVYKTLAGTLRTNQHSVQIVVGATLGDIALATSAADHPIMRAKSLNHNDMILAGMGLDGKDAYLSLAPYVAGMISGNNITHNLTNDSISALSVEKFFGDSNRDTETINYVKAGVLVVGTGKNGYYLVMGTNTYQNQATIWNESDKQTYLIQQRQIVDFVYAAFKAQQEQGVGADGYDVTAAVTKGNSILNALKGTYITDFKIVNARQEGNAIILEPQITPISSTDFIGFVLRVIIPS